MVEYGTGAYYQSTRLHTIVGATQWNQDVKEFDSNDMYHGAFWKEWYTCSMQFLKTGSEICILGEFAITTQKAMFILWKCIMWELFSIAITLSIPNFLWCDCKIL